MKLKTPSTRWSRGAAVLAGVCLLASTAAADDASALAVESTWVRETYDALILRPLAVVNMVAGAGCFAVAYPITLVTGGSDHVRRTFWDEPVERVFERPLGEL